MPTLENLKQALQSARDTLDGALAHVEDALAGRPAPSDYGSLADRAATPAVPAAAATPAQPGESFADTLETGDDAAATPAAPVIGQHDPVPPPLVGVPADEAASTAQEGVATEAPATTLGYRDEDGVWHEGPAPAGPPATENL